jgi:hypothetical protein
MDEGASIVGFARVQKESEASEQESAENETVEDESIENPETNKK